MAGNTPKQSFPQPFEAEGDIYPYGVVGPMARSPTPSYRTSGYPDYVSQYQTTPLANPAAVRAYTRNAPYMEEFVQDPQTMMGEIMRLRQKLADKPGDPVNEYRLRVLTQALSDIFGMGEKDARATAATTPMSDPSYLGVRTTGER